MRGFIIEAGVIEPVEVTVADITTDCCDVLDDGQPVCWHKKYKDVFLDLCISCNSPCSVYSAKSRPAFGKLVDLKKLNPPDAAEFRQRTAAHGEDLSKVYAQIPAMDCDNCGDCCGSYSIDLYSAEYFQILEFIKEKFSPADFNRIRGLCGMEMAIEERGLANMRRCPFRDENKKICVINEVKPLVCRQYCCEKVCAQNSYACKKEENHEMVSSLSAPFFIVRDQEILIFKINELNRWFLL